MNSGSMGMGWLVAIGLLAGLLGAAELGYRIGRRAHRPDRSMEGLGSIQGAILGLLALLLGFSFSGASTRFSERRQLIVDEANALSTLQQRLDLISPDRQAVPRGILREYVAERVAVYESTDPDSRAAALARAGVLLDRLWPLIVEASQPPTANTPLLVNAVNAVSDHHARRAAASRAHLPGLILLILLGCSFVAVLAVSYGCGVGGHRNGFLINALVVLVAAVLWTIIDLDHPRHGLIRAGEEPLLELRQRLGPTAPR